MKALALILLLIAGCSNTGTSSSGKGAPTYHAQPSVASAQRALQALYPEAAAYPITFSERWPHAYGVFYGEMIYLSKLWEKKAAREPKWGACLLVHEWLHSEGVGHGPEMDRRVRECRNTI